MTIELSPNFLPRVGGNPLAPKRQASSPPVEAEIASAPPSSQQTISALGRELATGRQEDRAENPLNERFAEKLESLKRLQEMPTQVKMNKVGFLQQRLEALKMLLLYASPEQVEALVEELKSISKELASIAKSLGDSGGGGVSLPSVAAIKGSDASFEDAKGVEAQAAMTEAQAALAVTKQADTQNSATTPDGVSEASSDDSAIPEALSETLLGRLQAEAAPSTQGGDDKALRILLEDAQKLLKEVIGLLKSKMGEADEETRKELADAEEGLRELNKALSRSSGDAPYTAPGSLLPDAGLGAPLAVSPQVGVSIDITV